MTTEEAIAHIEAQLHTSVTSTKEAWEKVKSDASLGACARKHWKALLTGVKRWGIQLELRNIKPFKGLTEADQEFGKALKEAGL